MATVPDKSGNTKYIDKHIIPPLRKKPETPTQQHPWNGE